MTKRRLRLAVEATRVGHREWSGGSRRAPKLRRVKGIAGSGPAASATGGGLCLELPGGARVAGLGVADVAALLRELR